MKSTLCIIAILFTFICKAQTISTDYKLHFGAGAIISTGSYAVVYLATKDTKKAFWMSIGASTAVGFAKEVIDSGEEGNRFDTAEWAITILGGAVATTTISLFTGKNKKKKRKEVALVN